MIEETVPVDEQEIYIVKLFQFQQKQNILHIFKFNNVNMQVELNRFAMVGPHRRPPR